MSDINLQIPLTIGRVNLETGDYINAIDPDSPDFVKEILASTAIPVVWQPVEIGGDLFVDGGVRNMTPVKDAMSTNPDHIIVVNTRPLVAPDDEKSLRSITEIAERSLDIILDEIFKEDLKRCMQINNLVQQAADQQAVLRSDSGEPLKHYELTIIEPPEPIGSSLNFDRDNLDKLLSMGRAVGKKVISESL